MAQIQKNIKKPKRKSDEIKIQMLEVLKNGKAYTFSRLSGELDTGYVTVTSNCEFLRMLGLIEVSVIDREDSASGKSQSVVRITKKGKMMLEDMER